MNQISKAKILKHIPALGFYKKDHLINTILIIFKTTDISIRSALYYFLPAYTCIKALYS